MANVYVLGTDDSNRVTLALHVDAPTGTNVAGLTYQVALARSGLYPAKTVLPDGDDTGGTIGATEKTAILNSSRVEVVRSFTPDAQFAGQSLAQKAAAVDAFYADAGPKIQAEITAKLKYFGVTR